MRFRQEAKLLAMRSLLQPRRLGLLRARDTAAEGPPKR
jgi:hypothetical protein